MAIRLTERERETLAIIRYLAAPHHRWVHEDDTRAPAAAARLVRKGYLEVKTERGPRGGEHRYYRPKVLPWGRPKV